jgi:hypothetical protein
MRGFQVARPSSEADGGRTKVSVVASVIGQIEEKGGNDDE